MPRFSRSSRANLQTADMRLQNILDEAIKGVDFSVICGRRSKASQDKAFRSGHSKVKWPDSKHNTVAPKPSKAVDIVPYVSGKGQVWEARQCYYLSGYIMAIVKDFGYPIRCGADWDEDGDVNDQNFRDVCHFELTD